MKQSNINKDETNLGEILKILKERYKLILIVTTLALLSSIAVNKYLLTPVYQTKALLMVTQGDTQKPVSGRVKGTGLEEIMSTVSSIPQMTINTYVGQLESEAVLARVIKKLELEKRGYTPSALGGLVSASAVQDTNLISVRVAHPNPVLAQQIANTLSEEFLGFISQINEQQMGKSVEFLKKQAETANKELNNARTNLQLIQQDMAGAAVLEQAMSAKNQELLEAQSQLIKVRVESQGITGAISQARHQLRVVPPSVTTQNEAGGPASVEPNPAYQELKARIDQRLIDSAQKRAEASSLEGIVASLTPQLKTLQIELSKKKSAFELAQKEVTRLEQTSTLIKTKINEAQVAKSLKLGETNLIIVSAASLPAYPFKPNKSLNIAVGVTLGLMVSVFLAFLFNYVDNTIKTLKEVEDYVLLPVLAQVPIYKPYKGKGSGPVFESSGQPVNM